MKGSKKYLFLLILIMLLFLPIIGLAAEDKEVAISDKNFKNALRELCGVEQGEKLYLSDVDKLSGDIDLSDKDIKSANGIKYLTNATSINLSYNNITEIRGDFSGLVKLKSLDLSNNDIYNKNSIYIEDIPNLESLDISANKMTYLIELFSKMNHLLYLDISANRMTDMSIALLDFNLIRLNCDYNFFDLSDGSNDREILDMLHEKGCEIHACRQLVSLPEISYASEGGNLVVKWKELYDVPFYDDSKGEIIGYTVLLDGKFQKSVSKDAEHYTINDVNTGKAHTISVSPDYNVQGYGDYKIRSYTVLENVTMGKSGPKLEENAVPVKYENYYSGLAVIDQPQETEEPKDESELVDEPTLTYDETKEEKQEEQQEEQEKAVEVQETFSKQPVEKSTNIVLLISLLVVILILISIISILLIKLWKNKNYVGRDEIDDEF